MEFEGNSGCETRVTLVSDPDPLTAAVDGLHHHYTKESMGIECQDPCLIKLIKINLF